MIAGWQFDFQAWPEAEGEEGYIGHAGLAIHLSSRVTRLRLALGRSFPAGKRLPGRSAALAFARSEANNASPQNSNRRRNGRVHAQEVLEDKLLESYEPAQVTQHAAVRYPTARVGSVALRQTVPLRPGHRRG